MAHPYVNDPVVSELDDIAQELEKTGNVDLATLVDEVSAELATSQRRKVSAKKTKKEEKPSAKSRAKKNKKPAKKEADTNFTSRRARIASAMRKIARAQVAELEDIAAELLKEGEKKAALEVLKIAEDLDSDYDYSSSGKHSAPEGKGDASKRFDREKANKPDAKMDAEEKEHLELPFGENGEGYPKQSAFDKQLDSLLRLAMEEEEGLSFGGEDESAEDADEELDMSDESEEGMEDEESEESEDSDEDSGDLDLDGLDSEEGLSDEGGEDADDMDLGGLDLGEGDDELASMMEAMDMESEPTDMEASDRMYEADEEGGEEGDELSEEDPMFPPAADDEEPSDDEELDMEEDSDTEAMDLLPNLEVSGPMGTGMKFSSSDKQKMVALAKKLALKGEKGLAARVAKLAKK